MNIHALAFLLTQLFAASSVFASSAPNDPLFSSQWALHNDGSGSVVIDFDNLHTIQQKAKSGVDIGWFNSAKRISKLATSPVVVAVIDSGIDMAHPDLANRISSEGYDFLSQSSIMSDPTGHGTEVAGVIVANANNEIGIAGIAPPSVKILPLRILGKDGEYQNFAYHGKLISDYAADAIRYAISHKASVINLSLGWPTLADNANIRKAVSEANAAGILLVATAGNDRKKSPSFPCSYEGVLCVGAVTNNGALADYSNFGGIVDILAPGDSITSTFPMVLESKVLRLQGYESVRGTSIAAPIVTAIAATIKSVYPKISLSELKARLFVSAGAMPLKDKKASSLFGIANIASAIDAKPRPLFYPHFKGTDEVTVDEKTLVAKGRIQIENLWAQASTVSANILINSKPAGSAQMNQVGPGESFYVDWQYQFTNIDESSTPQLEIEITSANTTPEKYNLDLTAVRELRSLTKQKIINVQDVDSNTWLPTTNATHYSLLKSVQTYGENTGKPRFYILSGANDQGSDVQIFDPNASVPVHKVHIPGIQKLSQIIRVDVNHSGTYSWVATGTSRDTNQAYFVFYFMNSHFENLFSSVGTSTWQLQLDASFGSLAIRDYSVPGSWLEHSGIMVPSFLGYGALPSIDNYDGLDTRHYQAGSHFYYLLPKAVTTDSKFVSLEVRAADNKKLRDSYENFNLQNLIPQSKADQKSGHVRILVALGSTVDAKTMTWDIASTSHFEAIERPGWDVLSASGQAIRVYTTDMANDIAAFNSLFDQETGSLAWLKGDGTYLARSEYSYQSAENQFVDSGVVGVYSLPNFENVWFVQTRFDLLAYHQLTNQLKPDISVISLDRDSTFPSQQYQSLLSPILVGTAKHPLPGLFLDSTLVRGDLISMAVFDPQTLKLQKPLRYSLRTPKTCVPMTNFYENAAIETFSLAFLCQTGANLEFRTIQFR